MFVGKFGVQLVWIIVMLAEMLEALGPLILASVSCLQNFAGSRVLRKSSYLILVTALKIINFSYILSRGQVQSRQQTSTRFIARQLNVAEY